MPTATIANPHANLTRLRAFYGDRARQKAIIDRVRHHQQQDEILQGATGGNNKWCAVACAINHYSHNLLACEMQIPISLIFANENIFERSAVGFANKWPLRFVSAPQLGADLSLVPHQLYVWLMTDPSSPYSELITNKSTLEMMREGADLMQSYIDGETRDQNQWRSLSQRALRALSALCDLRDLSDLSALRAMSDLSNLRDLSDPRALSDLGDLSALCSLRDLRALSDLGDLSALRDQCYLSDLCSLSDLSALRDLSALSDLCSLRDLRQKFFAVTGEKLLLLMAEAPVVAEKD